MFQKVECWSVGLLVVLVLVVAGAAVAEEKSPLEGTWQATDLESSGNKAPEDVVRFGNLLTNRLGGDADQVKAEVIHVEMQAGDRLLLCTDGLSDMADDVAIAGALTDTEPQPACDQLVQLALENGGKDTITVVVCDLSAAAEDGS